MDIKIDGLKYEIMEAALAQARDGRLHILGKLIETLASQKKMLKLMLQKLLQEEFNWCVDGPGGKVIQELENNWNNNCYQ
jgi:polyribonucleotide nucleotidyltransferase